MPEYLAPGVYVEEVPSGNNPIAGVGTSTAGFVGAAERGPLEPKFISNLWEFKQWYGDYIPKQSYLAYAVEGFFANGGQRCFVCRVVGKDSKFSAASVGKLKVIASGSGSWGDSVSIKLEQATQAIRALEEEPQPVPPKPQVDWVKATIEYKDGEEVKTSEVYDDLTHDPFASNNIQKVLNTNSKLIRVWWEDDAPEKLPADGAPVNLAGGADVDLTAADYAGTSFTEISGMFAEAPPADVLAPGTIQGLAALELIDEVAIVVAPDQARETIGPDITNSVISHCETAMKDRFAVLSVAASQNDVSKVKLPSDTSYAAYYYPWIKVTDPATNGIRTVPAVGHIAGIYARSDIERGVHKAPANEVVRNAKDLEFPVTKAMQDILNPRGVNCIRDFRSDGRGIRAWGARTMSSTPEWKYINVRRLFLFLEESIDEATQWVVFEPNGPGTWADVERAVGNFLRTQWTNGALMGATPDEAFFVACNRTTMTQDDIDNGRLICVIGVAPIKPAEFVIFRISQKTADAA
ncbi:MAG: phage tail sheath subtilisin-like domain-containing protein [Chloroflexota bacterium]